MWSWEKMEPLRKKTQTEVNKEAEQYLWISEETEEKF